MPDLTEPTTAPAAGAEDDIIQPFLLEIPALRGRLVRLGEVVDSILSRHSYPEPVAALLGELLALAGALSSMLKFDGVFTLQTKGDGPVSLMVADVTAAGELRGYAEVKPERLPRQADGSPPNQLTADQLLGAGHIAFTVDQGNQADRYQGIVELKGPGLADSVTHYFRQSEQLKTGVKLHAARVGGSWRAGALFLQQIPESGADTAVVGSDEEDDWRRALMLMASCTDRELEDPDLPANDLLYRLFHDERVRVYRPRPLLLGCRCSRARVAGILRSLPREEIEDMKLDGVVVVTCQFCNRDYRFDDDALDEIYGRPPEPG